MPVTNPARTTIGYPVISGTVGSVLFIGASSLLAQDNANFFWDDTNNRLGIGTAGAPATILDIRQTSGHGTVTLATGSTFETGSYVLAKTTTRSANGVLVGMLAESVSEVSASAPYWFILGLNAAASTSTADSHNYTASGGLTGGGYAGIHRGTGTHPLVRGITAIAQRGAQFIADSSGNVTTLAGCEFSWANFVGSGTVTNAIAIAAVAPSGTAGGTITNAYGLYIYSQTAAAGTHTNTPYGVYQVASANRNFFAGPVGLGIDPPATAVSFVHVAAGTTSKSAIRFASGVAPTTPAAGDVWYDGTNVEFKDGVKCATIDTGNGAVELAAGTYTPTLTNTANIAASTAYQCQYLRVGNTVTVSGAVDIDPTSASVQTALDISLPVSSTFGAVEDCAGVAACQSVAGLSAQIYANSSTAQLVFRTSDISDRSWSFTFTYQII